MAASDPANTIAASSSNASASPSRVRRPAITGNTLLSGLANTDSLSTDFTAADTLTVNGITINFNSGGGTTGSATAGTLDIDVTTGNVNDILNAVLANQINGARMVPGRHTRLTGVD